MHVGLETSLINIHAALLNGLFIVALLGFCTIYAFQTRKCPEGFNEARHLTFTNYTTCVIWLAFLPLFVLSTSTAIRSVTLSCLMSLSGAVQIACLFVPKVGLITSYDSLNQNRLLFRYT